MAADGYFFQGQCFKTLADYSSAYFTAAPVKWWVQGTTYVYTQAYILDAGTWKKQTLRYAYPGTGNPNQTTLTVESAPATQMCDPAENFLDGMQIGWAIATAMLLVYAVKFLWQSK